MADLHEVIETGPSPDHRVLRRATINCRICANFDIVLNDDTSKLRNRKKAVPGGGESKPLLSDPGTWVDVDACPQNSMAQGYMSANPAISADDYAASNNCARPYPAGRSYLCSGLDHGQRPDLR